MILDLSKYKLAWIDGDAHGVLEMTQDQIMVLADANQLPPEIGGFLALIPKEAKLSDCGGDDWDDCPAYCNASGFHRYPKGTVLLQAKLGGELRRINR